MARTNPDLFNVQSTSDFLKGYIDDFSVKEESIRAKLKGVGNDKAKRAKLESELADIIKQRNDFVEEAEGVIGSNYSPERAGMFMVRQQSLRSSGSDGLIITHTRRWVLMIIISRLISR